MKITYYDCKRRIVLIKNVPALFGLKDDAEADWIIPEEWNPYLVFPGEKLYPSSYTDLVKVIKQ